MNQKTSDGKLEDAVNALVMIDSKELFRGTKKVIIKHHHAFYHLIITKQDKLILNK